MFNSELIKHGWDVGSFINGFQIVAILPYSNKGV